MSGPTYNLELTEEQAEAILLRLSPFGESLTDEEVQHAADARHKLAELVVERQGFDRTDLRRVWEGSE